ncbi:MAG: halocyanin domain-containing protein [Halobacteriota archaeon]
MKRRDFVLTTAAVGAAGVTGCLNGGDNGDDENESDNGDDNGDNGDETDYELVDEEPDYAGYLDGTEKYEEIGGTVDWTGESEVTVLNGTGDGGTQFEPPAIAIDVGTNVIWEWTGEGGGHNVVRVDDHESDTGGEWEGDDEIISEEGHTYEFTFEEPGTYIYECVPHRANDMLGTVVVEGDGDENGGEDGGDGNETEE